MAEKSENQSLPESDSGPTIIGSTSPKEAGQRIAAAVDEYDENSSSTLRGTPTPEEFSDILNTPLPDGEEGGTLIIPFGTGPAAELMFSMFLKGLGEAWEKGRNSVYSPMLMRNVDLTDLRQCNGTANCSCPKHGPSYESNSSSDSEEELPDLEEPIIGNTRRPSTPLITSTGYALSPEDAFDRCCTPHAMKGICACPCHEDESSESEKEDDFFETIVTRRN